MKFFQNLTLAFSLIFLNNRSLSEENTKKIAFGIAFCGNESHPIHLDARVADQALFALKIFNGHLELSFDEDDRPVEVSDSSLLRENRWVNLSLVISQDSPSLIGINGENYISFHRDTAESVEDMTSVIDLNRMKIQFLLEDAENASFCLWSQSSKLEWFIFDGGPTSSWPSNEKINPENSISFWCSGENNNTDCAGKFSHYLNISDFLHSAFHHTSYDEGSRTESTVKYLRGHPAVMTLVKNNKLYRSFPNKRPGGGGAYLVFYSE